MSHTPGPWTYVANWQSPGHLKGGFVKCNYDVEIGVNPRIAFVSVIPQGSQELCDANGRLIAAAPDLLEALEELVAECGVDPKPLKGMSYFNAQIGPEAYQAAKAAIAKAKEGF